MLQQPLVGAVLSPARKGAQATARGVQNMSPALKLHWIDQSKYRGGWNVGGHGTAQPSIHVEVNYSWTLIPARAVSLLGKMFTQRTMSYFLCAQLGGGRVRCWSTQTAVLAAALAWARVCGHRASHSDLVQGTAILTWSSVPSARPCNSWQVGMAAQCLCQAGGEAGWQLCRGTGWRGEV